MPSLRIQLLRGLLAAPLCLAMLAGHALPTRADAMRTPTRAQTAPRSCDAPSDSAAIGDCSIAASMPVARAAADPRCAA